MGTSGNPAKKAAAKKVADVSAFKKRSQGIDLKLPSELWVKAKRVELQTFIRQGNIPNPLMEVVSEALEKGQKANVSDILGDDGGKIDMDTVNEMYEMVESVCINSIVAPKVHRAPTQDDLMVWNEQHPDETLDDPEELRRDDLLYVDEIDDEDKMFVFQWATGGTADVERFREEAAADLAALAEGESPRAAAKRTAGSR